MAKVTSKLQVTIPKSLADELRIKPGDEIEWSAAGEAIRLSPARDHGDDSTAERLSLFDAATVRQRRRQKRATKRGQHAHRGWSREDLYRRGRSR
jgi:AbrB family looped-hinge helix DNA binding protein